MIIAINKFYRYKGPSDFFFKNGEVYKLIVWSTLSDEPFYTFENYKGYSSTYYGDIKKVFISAGVPEVNWKNRAYKKDVQVTSTVDNVNHPKHYTWLKDLCGIEVIDITRHLNFNVGNAIKYLLRKDKEDIISLKEKRIEDLKKAKWYIEDEIKKLQNAE